MNRMNSGSDNKPTYDGIKNPFWLNSTRRDPETKNNDQVVTLEMPMPKDNPIPMVLALNGVYYTPITGYSSKLLPPHERLRRRKVYNRIKYAKRIKANNESHDTSKSSSAKRKAADDAGSDQKKHKTEQNNTVK